MEEITNYFSFWREAISIKEDSLNESNVKQCFATIKERYDVYSNIPLEEFSISLSKLFSQQGVDNLLTQAQKKTILDKLNSTAVGGKLMEDHFVTCLKYWTRKAIAPCTVLLIVDVQNDFIRGSLRLDQCPAKQDGEEVVPVINELIECGQFDVVAYSHDWHPADHCSYHSNLAKTSVHGSVKISDVKLLDKILLSKPVEIEQIMWPDHCKQNSWGAELHKDLRKPNPNTDIEVFKGQCSDVDSYSAFWDNGKLNQTELFLKLLKRGVTDVYVCGLAFDFCVKFTAEEAAELGFNTFVIKDACRGVCFETICEAEKTLQHVGVKLLQREDIS